MTHHGPAIMLGVLAAGISGPPAMSAERWSALSKTADSVTGDIMISKGRVTMSRRIFRTGRPITLHGFVADLEPPPVEAEARPVLTPSNPMLLNGNRLCPQATRWIVLWKTKEGLGMSAFTSRDTPHDIRSRDGCGTYYYVPHEGSSSTLEEPAAGRSP